MIDRATVQHVATLARLGLTEDEIELFAPQLSRILAFVELIADSAEAGATAFHPGSGDAALRLRPDEVLPSLDRAIALANTSAVEAGFVRVPAVLD